MIQRVARCWASSGQKEYTGLFRHSSGVFRVSTVLSILEDDQKSFKSRIPCFQTMTMAGESHSSWEKGMSTHLLLDIYKTMLKARVMDTTFHQSQRQGRISFYLTSEGEEAAIVASAAALDPNDQIFSQYREGAALLWRGYSIQEMANQCMGNKEDSGKGRQMPIHYGCVERNFQTVSSPLATQLLHAVGYAYALKLESENLVAAAYFGEGATSEGDFHAALNFGASLKCPVLFICRNNGWAISTPVSEQYKGEGIAAKAISYGVPSIRVDGGDARAVYLATREARNLAVERSCPVLLEMMTQRLGDHSTSDDATAYMSEREKRYLSVMDPLPRLKNHLVSVHVWSEALDQQARDSFQLESRQALKLAEGKPLPSIESMFDDVYDVLTPNLLMQRASAIDFAKWESEFSS